jgi:hypothetical protein
VRVSASARCRFRVKLNKTAETHCLRSLTSPLCEDVIIPRAVRSAGKGVDCRQCAGSAVRSRRRVCKHVKLPLALCHTVAGRCSCPVELLPLASRWRPKLLPEWEHWVGL